MVLRRVAFLAMAVSAVLALSVSGSTTARSLPLATPMPDRVFSPYFETWTAHSITAIAQK